MQTPSQEAEPGPGTDAAEFEAWVAPHWSAITGLAHRMAGSADAEDVAQDTLILAWRKRHRFDPSLGTARVWLLTLTADQASRTYRRRRRRVVTVSADLDSISMKPPDARSGELREAIDVLSVRQRLAVALYYYVALPIKEVAAIMRCSEGTVKSTLADARTRLRGLLEDDDGQR